MAQQFQLADAQQISEISAVGQELDPAEKLGFDIPAGDRMRGVWNPAEQTYYLLFARGSDTTLHIYKAKDVLRNKWHPVAGEEPDADNSPYSIAAGEIKYPLVTGQGTMLLPVAGSSAEILRLPTDENDEWAQSAPTTVHSGGAPLWWSKESSIDAKGDIYAGDYKPDNKIGGQEVIKSTDDGQTWTAVHSTSHDLHIHSVAVSPHQDQMLIVWGDNNHNVEVRQKDGSNGGIVNAMGSDGSVSYQGVPAIVGGVTSPIGNNISSEIYMTGSDQYDWHLNRAQAQIKDDGSLSYDCQYGVPRAERIAENQCHMTDLLRVGGSYVGLSKPGMLSVSHDGWFWDRVPVPFVFDTRYPNTLTETPRWLVAAGRTLSVIPKDILNQIDPRQTVYQWVDGTQTTTGDGYVTFNLRLDNIEDMDVFLSASGASDVNIYEFTQHGGNNKRTTIASLGAAGGESGTFSPKATNAWLEATNLGNDVDFEMTVKKR